MSESIKKFETTTKDKFKAILKLNGITHKDLAHIMGISEESARQLIYRRDRNPKYVSLVVELFQRFLDK